MIRRSILAAADADLRALTKGRGSPVRNITLVAIPVGAVLGALAYAMSRSWAVAAIAFVLFVAASAWSNMSFFREVKRRTRTCDAAIECFEIEACQVVELEPHGSNEPAWAFLTDDGQCLLLVGQWLREKRKMPALSFRLFRWTVDGEPARIETSGRKVKPTMSNAGLKPHHRVASIQQFPARFASLEADLDHALGEAARVHSK